jgi:putative photosynthetic complex assembly protein
VAYPIGHRFPRAPLVGMWGLVVFVLLAAGLARLTGTEGSWPTSKPVAVQDLRFEDMADGGVAVFAAHADKPFATVVPGSNGFLRATLRGLARERRRQDLGREQPFRLTRWSDGRLTLEDLATARYVDLGAFGTTNAQAFARLLNSNGAMQ